MLKLQLQYLATWCEVRLIGKDPDAGKDWRREEKEMTENEIVGWHHWWTWVWVSSGSWWWRGKPGELQAWDHRVTHNWVTGLNWLDCRPPGSSAHGISQARILKWVAISSSRGSSQPRDWTCIYWFFCIVGGFFFTWWVTKEAPMINILGSNWMLENRDEACFDLPLQRITTQQRKEQMKRTKVETWGQLGDYCNGHMRDSQSLV